MTTILINCEGATAHPEFVAALEAVGAEVLVVDWDPAEEVGVSITEHDDPCSDTG